MPSTPTAPKLPNPPDPKDAGQGSNHQPVKGPKIPPNA